MNAALTIEWQRENHRYLMTALDRVREELGRHAARLHGEHLRDDRERDENRHEVYRRDEHGGDEELRMIEESMSAPPMLEEFCRLLDLSWFERRLILLSAGRDLDGDFDHLFAAAQGNPGASYPTMRLALALWPDGDRSALAPHARLSRLGVIEIDAGPTSMTRPLRLSERVLHYIDGVETLDETLHAIIRPAHAAYASAAATLGSLEGIVRGLVETLGYDGERSAQSALELCGGEYAAKQAIAIAAADAMHRPIYVLGAHDIPAVMADQERLARLWELEALLSGGILFVDCQEAESHEALRNAGAFLDRLDGAVLVAVRDPIRLRRGVVRIDVNRPGAAEQIELWEDAFGESMRRVREGIDPVVGQFNLGASDIYAIGGHVAARLAEEPLADGPAILWDACRMHARPRLDGLAERLAPHACWDDLVLPEAQLQTIHEIAAHVRQRMKVYHHWGLERKSGRGLGIGVLFAGPSGTGKTLSAEVIAAELQLDLYHIDLSQVVSKYIGETEKNLRRIFDAAEEAGAVLLFDEADALFGKRSEVKDSHDRHANIEVSYLLQKMEAYRGLAILTTNLKDALDPAFLRRIRFVVNFPFPDASQREAIWRRIYPPELPTRGLDFEKLSRLNVAGGNIRNIALNAAFLAAEEGAPVEMRHLLRASRGEFIKLEKPLTEAEIGGWVEG